ncbi:MAG TPA: radical SAM family heme chaperone HemW [Methylomirabilota bacterium]|jgi:oxygen-independent coproporphyrinogen-3 oxidase|nr:radical SAM family heme chaperone HemW [Methylomirabilota bacterium]
MQPPRGHGLGLYIHVPFCTKRCHYCSFNTAPLERDEEMRRYVGAARREIELLGAAPWARDVRIATIFFGGGTPSLLAPDDLASILDSVRGRFALAPDREVTVECNPESVSRSKLAAYRAAGVNRISLGVQSLDDGILPRLGRLHDAGGARAAFEAAREAGHDNVSIDLMYGLPEQDLATWARSIEGVLDWAPEHLSAYGLTLDAGSLWAVTGVANLPAEETVVQQYWRLARAAAARGFEHYEISNYARPGLRSRHNQVYWRAAEYLAVGPGACGYLGDVRYANLKPVTRYCATLEAGALPIDTSEHLTPRQRLGERVMLGLRLIDGVPQAWLDERLSGDAGLARRAEGWRDAGLTIARGDRIALTESGFLVSDSIFSELL